MSLPDLSASEREALRWLTSNGDTEFYSSALAGLYAERAAQEARENGWPHSPGIGRTSAWNRTSGSVMARLRRKGALIRVSLFDDAGSQRYRITREAQDALAVDEGSR